MPEQGRDPAGSNTTEKDSTGKLLPQGEAANNLKNNKIYNKP